MERNRYTEGGWSQINRPAMQYGLWLGAFWVFRYLFLIVAGFGVSDRFKFLYYLMSIVTLLMMYVFYYKYKAGEGGKPRGTVYCILFMVLMCFYASFPEGAIMYAHFKFIDPAYFADLVTKTLGMISSHDTLIAIFSSKAIYIVFEFMKNISLGLFMGVILNFVVNSGK